METVRALYSFFTCWKTPTSSGCKMWVVCGGNPRMSICLKKMNLQDIVLLSLMCWYVYSLDIDVVLSAFHL